MTCIAITIIIVPFTNTFHNAATTTTTTTTTVLINVIISIAFN